MALNIRLLLVICIIILVMHDTDAWWWRRRRSSTTTTTTTTTTRRPPSNVLNLISKAGWGGRRARSYTTLSTPTSKVVIHHTTGSACFNQNDCSRIVRGHQNYHMDDRKWDDIGYNFLVGEDGNVYEGRGWDRVGAHARGYNSLSHGIAVIGDFTNRSPNGAALNAIKALIAHGLSIRKISGGYSVEGHRDIGSTSCPGNQLYATISTWAHFTG